MLWKVATCRSIAQHLHVISVSNLQTHRGTYLARFAAILIASWQGFESACVAKGARRAHKAMVKLKKRMENRCSCNVSYGHTHAECRGLRALHGTDTWTNPTVAAARLHLPTALI